VTERPEGVEAGVSQLVRLQEDSIVDAVSGKLSAILGAARQLAAATSTAAAAAAAASGHQQTEPELEAVAAARPSSTRNIYGTFPVLCCVMLCCLYLDLLS
jgi:hypothetical protein